MGDFDSELLSITMNVQIGEQNLFIHNEYR